MVRRKLPDLHVDAADTIPEKDREGLQRGWGPNRRGTGVAELTVCGWRGKGFCLGHGVCVHLSVYPEEHQTKGVGRETGNTESLRWTREKGPFPFASRNARWKSPDNRSDTVSIVDYGSQTMEREMAMEYGNGTARDEGKSRAVDVCSIRLDKSYLSKCLIASVLPCLVWYLPSMLRTYENYHRTQIPYSPQTYVIWPVKSPYVGAYYSSRPHRTRSMPLSDELAVVSHQLSSCVISTLMHGKPKDLTEMQCNQDS